MHSPLVRRSLVAFHLVLGGGLLIGSVQAFLEALPTGGGPAHLHLALLAGEALGAALFLLVPLLEGADEAAAVRSALHPRLGTPMRLIDLALFTAEHDDHHLAAITALRQRWGGA